GSAEGSERDVLLILQCGWEGRCHGFILRRASSDTLGCDRNHLRNGANVARNYASMLQTIHAQMGARAHEAPQSKQRKPAGNQSNTSAARLLRPQEAEQERGN